LINIGDAVVTAVATTGTAPIDPNAFLLYPVLIAFTKESHDPLNPLQNDFNLSGLVSYTLFNLPAKFLKFTFTNNRKEFLSGATANFLSALTLVFILIRKMFTRENYL
jgi:hypothetical protein